MAEHDQSYKLLFSHKELVENLLRGFIDPPWVDELDFSTLERISGTYVSDDLRERLDDMVWRARWKDRDLYIYILLEFQSEPDRLMALRMMVYLGLLLQDLARWMELGATDRLPPVLPLVLYDGDQPWTAPRNVGELIAEVPGLDRDPPSLGYLLIDEGRYDAGQLELLDNLAAALFRMELSRGPEELSRVLESLAGRLPGPEHRELREFQTMLEKRVQEWTWEWKRQGLEEGRREGHEQGRKEGREEGRKEGRKEGEALLLLQQIDSKFGSIPPEIESRIRGAGPRRLLAWGRRLLTAERLDDVFG